MLSRSEEASNQVDLACLPTRLVSSCQLRNFPCEFTEKCFVIFDQSVSPIFGGIFLCHSFYCMTS